MKKWTLILALLLGPLLGLTLLSSVTHDARQIAKDYKDTVHGDDRYVDLGVAVLVVRADPNGKELAPGAPLLSVIREHRRGGLYDTSEGKWVGPSLAPVTWLVSEEQEPIVLHSGDMPEAVWMQGSMGAGKTTALCIWLGLRMIEHATHGPRAAGVTAPTYPRMEGIRTALFGPKGKDGSRVGGMWPAKWATYREGDQVATCATGLQIEFRSTHIQSASAGSPIQGQNWSFVANDELQDYYELNGDIRMRGRSAYKGRYQRFVTVTPKDDPGYRTFRDDVEGKPDLWFVQRVLGPNSPFVHASHWENSKKSMGLREYQRKVLAMDVAAEGVVYNSWDRALNLAELPTATIPRWQDVTRRELGKWGRNFEILVGYDPGRLFDVSILLKAFQPPTPAPTRAVPHPRVPDPVWFVIGEVTTERQTTAHHCRALLKVVREKYGCNLAGDGPQIFVRGDPATTSGTDEESPHTTVYEVFRQYGIAAKAAAYKPGSVAHGRVPKEARIDMVNTLLCNVEGERRLLVACDSNRKPVAPKLVEALERMERDGDNRAEHDRKDKHDLSHWACALGYALWSIEKPRAEARVA